MTVQYAYHCNYLLVKMKRGSVLAQTIFFLQVLPIICCNLLFTLNNTFTDYHDNTLFGACNM